MRIKQVTAYQPATPGSPPDWRTQLGQIVVAVEDSDGQVGYGVGGGGAAGVHIVETVIRDLLLEREADDVEALQATMFHHTCFYGRMGVVVMAISGVDLALWDLRAKRQQQHVAEQLGLDQLETTAPMYSTVWGAEAAEEAVANGATAIKLHVERFGDRPDPNAIAQVVRETRARLGAEARIMIDAFGRWDLDSTRRVDERLAEWKLDWIEEPLPPDDLDGYAHLASSCQAPIAAGEHEYGRDGFIRLINAGVRVLQPDVNWCGGLTTLREVYQLAAERNIEVCPHRGAEPYALPAILALDPTPLAESPRSWFNCLQPPIRINGSEVSLAPGHGFGVSPVGEIRPPHLGDS